jgi:hypothetical protein
MIFLLIYLAINLWNIVSYCPLGTLNSYASIVSMPEPALNHGLSCRLSSISEMKMEISV